jgi:hypothetical protein
MEPSGGSRTLPGQQVPSVTLSLFEYGTTKVPGSNADFAFSIGAGTPTCGGLAAHAVDLPMRSMGTVAPRTTPFHGTPA